MGCSISMKNTMCKKDGECLALGETLNSAEILLIRQTWLSLEQDIKNIGKELFLRYFEKNPSYQNLFPEFRNLSRTEMEQSRAVLGHGKRVMKAIENAVATLHDHEVLKSYSIELGKRHVNRKLKEYHLKDMRRAFIDVIRERLKDVWTREAAIAWSKLFCRISNGILKGISASC
ncbi:cytoglobin-2-like [Actinia tenebrosa]|uniref:Cytoglobin-2-like n=1 Tax=Actinia tenebrosa TaxID=6105 RepID=A0A6P8HK71_ACTTE|nr:cytoglobin-2-like [Actinia tenebrosa]